MGSTGVEYPMMMSTVFLGLLACVLVPCFVNGAWKEDCEQGFVKISGQCYHFSKNKVNYDTAVTRCKARTGELLQENEAQSDVKNHLVEINKGEWGANRRVYWVGGAMVSFDGRKDCPSVGPSPYSQELTYFTAAPSLFKKNSRGCWTSFNFICKAKSITRGICPKCRSGMGK